MDDAPRLVMHEGASLADGRVLGELGGLLAWGVVTLAIAVRIFRWV